MIRKRQYWKSFKLLAKKRNNYREEIKTWNTKLPFGIILQGAEQRCLDWSKAVEIIKKNYRPNMIVYAGINGDWEDTAGIVFENGKSVNTDAVVNTVRKWYIAKDKLLEVQ